MLREKQENRVVCRREWTDGIPPLPLLTPLDVLRFSVSVRGPASQRSLSPSGHRAVPLFLSHTHTHTRARSLFLFLFLRVRGGSLVSQGEVQRRELAKCQ